MSNSIDPKKQAILHSSQTVLTRLAHENLPRLEDLPEPRRQELIQALASLMIHDPALQPWLEGGHYEPK